VASAVTITGPDLAAGLVGQERVLGWLDAAAARPNHAYLIVSAHHDDGLAAARYFAARVLDSDASRRRQIALGEHVDVREFEPDGPSYKVDFVKKRIIVDTLRVPMESDAKVVIIHEAERMCLIANSANAFLKTLEEPPPRTVIVLVTTAPDDLLPTIRSRCTRIDLDPVLDDQVRLALETDGSIKPDEARRVAALSGGQIRRARDLAERLAAVRFAFAAAPGRLDRSGATVARVAHDLDAAVVAAYDELDAALTAAEKELEADLVAQGYEAKAVKSRVKVLADKHKRLLRRARMETLFEGVTAIESVLFDALSGVAPRNDDVAPLGWDPRRCAAGLDACRAAREAIAINEKGTLHLEHLLLSLDR
jgi:DNA polymerase-3 subunit delta'